MTATALLRQLRAQGITLTPEGAGLRFAAPRGKMTPLLREQIARHKEALREILGAKAGPWDEGEARLLVRQSVEHVNAAHGARGFDAPTMIVFDLELAAAFAAQDVREIRSLCTWFEQESTACRAYGTRVTGKQEEPNR